MTRTDARMIAEELYRLMKNDGQIKETWLTAKEAASHIGKSYSWMQKNGISLPRTKLGGQWRYPKSQLNTYLNR